MIKKFDTGLLESSCYLAPILGLSKMRFCHFLFNNEKYFRDQRFYLATSLVSGYSVRLALPVSRGSTFIRPAAVIQVLLVQ